MAGQVYIREDMAIIHVHVSGFNPDIVSVFSWSALEGGTVTANSVFTRPGGMLPGFQIGGPSERGDITVRRQMIPELNPFIPSLEDACGKAVATASYQLLDNDGNPYAATTTMKGILKEVVRTNFDSNNAAAAFLGLVIALNEQASRSS